METLNVYKWALHNVFSCGNFCWWHTGCYALWEKYLWKHVENNIWGERHTGAVMLIGAKSSCYHYLIMCFFHQNFLKIILTWK
jgi:hypothetical protein